MQTSVIGFPRVGELRELKFATEKFFKGLVSEQELEALAKDIRKKQWLKMQEKEVDFIPSNDFSFYDNFLDAAVLFNIIPERYRELSLSPLEKYFAMARGYKGPAGDVKALAMKKWFNTNYHYMVAAPSLYREEDGERFPAAGGIRVQGLCGKVCVSRCKVAGL